MPQSFYGRIRRKNTAALAGSIGMDMEFVETLPTMVVQFVPRLLVCACSNQPVYSPGQEIITLLLLTAQMILVGAVGNNGGTMVICTDGDVIVSPNAVVAVA